MLNFRTAALVLLIVLTAIRAHGAPCDLPGLVSVNGVCRCSAGGGDVDPTNKDQVDQCSKEIVKSAEDHMALTSRKVPASGPGVLECDKCQPFNAAENCPVVLLNQIWRDRHRPELSLEKSPKEACPLDEDKSLNKAEDLEALLASNPGTHLGLDYQAVTAPQCLPPNYRARDPQTAKIMVGMKETVTEQERMMAVAEYYFHMNRIKIAEINMLAQLAVMDSVQGRKPLADVDCSGLLEVVKPWCQTYKSCGGETDGMSVLKKQVDDALKDRAAIEAEKAPLMATKDQPETKARLYEKDQQIKAVESLTPMIAEDRFKSEFKKTGDVEHSIRQQLTTSSKALGDRLEGLKKATRCLNSADQKDCSGFDKIMNTIPNVIPPLKISGSAADRHKQNVAQSFIERVQCYQEARGVKTQKNQSLMLDVVDYGLTAETLVTGGAGAPLKAGYSAARKMGASALKEAAVSLAEKEGTALLRSGAIKLGEEEAVALGLAKAANFALYAGGAATIHAFKVRDECQNYMDELKNLSGEFDSLPAKPVCPAYSRGKEAVVTSELSRCMASGARAAWTLAESYGVGTKTFRNIGAKAIKSPAGKAVRGVVVGSLGLSVGSGILTNYGAGVLNIWFQYSNKKGTQATEPLQKGSMWVISRLDKAEIAKKSRDVKELKDAVETSNFADVPPDQAQQTFNSLKKKGVDIMLSGKKRFRDDERDGNNQFRDSYMQAVWLSNLTLQANNVYSENQKNLDDLKERLQKESRGPTSKEREAMMRYQNLMTGAELNIASNFAAWTVFDFMYPQYQEDKPPTGVSLSDWKGMEKVKADSFSILLRTANLSLLKQDMVGHINSVLKALDVPFSEAQTVPSEH